MGEPPTPEGPLDRRDLPARFERWRGVLATWPRRVAVLLGALELIYLIAANVFLNSRAGMAVMNREPDKVRVAYDRAWTPLPGLVRVHALALDGESRRVRWRTRIDRAWTMIWTPSLLFKHVRIVSSTPTGVDVDVEALPKPDQPPPRKPGRGWQVTLGGLRVDDFRRLRVNENEIAADGLLRGSIRFEVRGPMELDIDRLRFDDGVVRSAGQEVAKRLHLDAELATEPWRVGLQTVAELIAGATGEVELDARVESIGFLDAYLRKLPWLGLGGSGDLALELAIDRGSLLPGSALAVSGDAIFADLFDVRARGRGRIAGTVDSEERLQLGASLKEFSVERASDGMAILVGEGLESIVTVASTRLYEPPEEVAGAIKLDSARAEDLSRFGPYVPGGLELDLEQGAAELSMSLSYDTGARSGQGELDVALRDVVAGYADARIAASGALEVLLPALDLVGGRFDLSGTRLVLEGGRIERRGEVKSEDWGARLAIASGVLDLPPRRADAQPEDQRAVALSADFAVTMSDTLPIVVIMEQHLPKLRFIDGLLTISEVEASGRVEARGDALGLHGIEVSGGERDQLTILLDLDLAGSGASGVAYARYRALDASVALHRGERDWGILHARRHYEQALAEYVARRGDRR
jgi:hypothetical protein